MIKLGVLEDTKPKLQNLFEMISSLGTSGDIILKPTLSGFKEIQITDDVKLKIETPTTINYVVTPEGVDFKIKAEVFYGRLSPAVSGVSVSLTRIQFQLDWCPDTYFEVKS